MKKILPLALLAAFPLAVQAQSIDELRREQRALKEKVDALEKKLKDAEAKPASGGMTEEQQRDFNRIAIKTEALEDSQEAMGFRLLKISGQMDPSFIYNKLQRRSGFQFLNKVEDGGYNYDNSYFGMAILDFQKELEGGTKWRFTLAPNRGVGSVFDGNSPVHEATVSIPLSDLQTRFIAGQIPDWSGYEYLQPTLNKLITHNLLFDFTLPTAYTGAGFDITRGKWIYKAVIANMNKSTRDQRERSPVFAYRVDYSRGEFQGFGFAGVHGKAANLTENVVDILGEPVPQRDSTVNLFEFDAYFIRGDWTAQAQVTYGMQRNAAVTVDPVTNDLRDAQWWGLSTLVAHKFTPRFEGIMRMDYLNNRKNGGGLLGYTTSDDRNGIGPDGTLDCLVFPATEGCSNGANRFALSLGVGYLFNLNTTLKAEYRLDRATEAVFLDAKNGGYKKTNHLIGLGVVVSF
ncbi:DUF3138 family protein [Piscinibacter gummiphilus]|uniref:DUF3138 family protein n=1 Tax=Piscinibacter gummiphilus TaxID=946333 RepID=A0ABZ0D0N0_9BURK|nr:DUF3138 family protein [Piscinibacter gummiphilus]WOB10795.1 DUF3138 family protein [Piscinibacter gummiphilus]